MLHLESKHRRPLPTFLFLGALALTPLLAAGCGESGTPVPAKVESASKNTPEAPKPVASAPRRLSPPPTAP
jgi:hypothetical protein